MTGNAWVAIIAGDQDAFLGFYKSSYQQLYAVGYRICGNKEMVKDGIQELFMELWKSRATVNPRVENALSYLMTWLRRIIARQMKNNLSDRFYNPQYTDMVISYEQLLINQQGDDETKQRLASAFQHLTPKQLKIIRSRFFDEKTYDEIASENNMAKQSVYNTIHKVLDILKKHFTQKVVAGYCALLTFLASE
jgi:RNA polymerase sigma factor (sigma-70 family)